MAVELTESLNKIEQLVGQDVWVAAKVRKTGYSGKSYTEYCYMKVLSEQDETNERGYSSKTFTIITLDMKHLSRSGVKYCTQESKDYILRSKGITVPAYAISLIEPLDIATTDEILKVVD